jgi:hypothetical protein
MNCAQCFFFLSLSLSLSYPPSLFAMESRPFFLHLAKNACAGNANLPVAFLASNRPISRKHTHERNAQIFFADIGSAETNIRMNFYGKQVFRSMWIHANQDSCETIGQKHEMPTRSFFFEISHWKKGMHTPPNAVFLRFPWNCATSRRRNRSNPSNPWAACSRASSSKRQKGRVRRFSGIRLFLTGRTFSRQPPVLSTEADRGGTNLPRSARFVGLL